MSVKDIILFGKVKCIPPNTSHWPELAVTDQRYAHFKMVKIRNRTIKMSELALYWPLARETDNDHDDQEGHKNSKEEAEASSKIKHWRWNTEPAKGYKGTTKPQSISTSAVM